MIIRKLAVFGMAFFVAVGLIAIAPQAPASAQSAIYTCDALTVAPTGDTTVKATLSYTAKYGAGMQMTTYDFGDGKVVGTHETTVSHTYAQPGTYTVQAKMRVIIDNVRTVNDVTSPACTQTVTVGSTTAMQARTAPVATTAAPSSASSAPQSATQVTELPKTGTSDTILGLIGLALIIFLSITYVRQEQKRAL